MARRNPTARRNRTKARRRSSITTSATASSKMSPRRQAWPIRPASRSASRSSITTTTAGPIYSSPTTRSPTSSTAICRTARFKEEGLAAGVAFGEDGVARGAMGVDAADYDRSGRQHLIVGNFSNQMLGLYHNEGNGLFVDEAPRSPVGRASLLSLTFGLFFFDYDLDGYPDIFAANGHIEEEIGRVQPKIQYAEMPLLFRNAGGGKFQAGARVFKAIGGARRGLRRLRSRRRPRRSGRHQQRSRLSLPQRRRQSQSLAAGPSGRNEKQSRRNRRRRAGRDRRCRRCTADRATARPATWR